MTGLPYWVGLALLIAAAILLLLALAMLSVDRHQRARMNDPRDDSLDTLLTPKTTALPQIAPPNRKPGALFTPHGADERGDK